MAVKYAAFLAVLIVGLLIGFGSGYAVYTPKISSLKLDLGIARDDLSKGRLDLQQATSESTARRA